MAAGLVEPSAALIQQAVKVPDFYKNVKKEVRDLVNGSAVAKLFDLGKSHEKKDIFAVKISDNPATNEKKELELLYIAMHHARELCTTSVAVEFIKHLTEKYAAGDKDIKKLVDTSEIWIIPVLNPDGYGARLPAMRPARIRVRRTANSQITRRPCSGRSATPLRELSGPIFDAFKASCMTDDELGDFLERAKHEMRAERRAKKRP